MQFPPDFELKRGCTAWRGRVLKCVWKAVEWGEIRLLHIAAAASRIFTSKTQHKGCTIERAHTGFTLKNVSVTAPASVPPRSDGGGHTPGGIGALNRLRELPKRGSPKLRTKTGLVRATETDCSWPPRGREDLEGSKGYPRCVRLDLEFITALILTNV